MTAPPRMVMDPALARYFEPGLHEPMAQPAVKRTTSRYTPATSVAEAEHRLYVALKALRKAADEVMALPEPKAQGRLIEPYASLHHRREACGELLDRALADVERLERLEREQLL